MAHRGQRPTGVPTTTVWRATDWCVRYVNGQPFDFFVRGAQVTGNRAEILYDGRPRTPIVGYGGKCLDVLGFNTANGARPGLWDCNGAENQKWTVTR
ncbi:ricin-type beta-trefoil lectin domain protein [Streptomyces sp. x-19]|uniref:ricin-type beta-trefoil lectin domain protein n=1 Tax=Streptomyces sp. x-19 TaxID=2789280 RepID=UPI003980C2DB